MADLASTHKPLELRRLTQAEFQGLAQLPPRGHLVRQYPQRQHPQSV
jgi:hypothetical protein